MQHIHITHIHIQHYTNVVGAFFLDVLLALLVSSSSLSCDRLLPRPLFTDSPLALGAEVMLRYICVTYVVEWAGLVVELPDDLKEVEEDEEAAGLLLLLLLEFVLEGREGVGSSLPW